MVNQRNSVRRTPLDECLFPSRFRGVGVVDTDVITRRFGHDYPAGEILLIANCFVRNDEDRVNEPRGESETISERGQCRVRLGELDLNSRTGRKNHPRGHRGTEKGEKELDRGNYFRFRALRIGYTFSLVSASLRSSSPLPSSSVLGQHIVT